MNKNTAQDGFTLIELIIAMAISSIVLTLVFTLFTDTTKGIQFQNRRAEKVHSMIINQKRIDTAIKKIKYITAITETYCDAKNSSDSALAIQFRNNELLVNETVIATNISQFTFSTSIACQNKTILLWNCLLSNDGWIGGATSVYSGVVK